MRKTHYIPTFDEFHPGFECERYWRGTVTIIKGRKVQDDTKETTGWQKAIVRETAVEEWDYIDFDDIIIDIKDKDVRVKYLDREDIESQDFVIQQSTWDRKSLKRMVIKYVPHPKFDSGAQFEKVINETLVWQIFWNTETGDMIIVKAHNERKRRLVWSEFKDKKEKTPPEYFMEFDERFKGVIKNKSEFKRILRQTGVVK